MSARGRGLPPARRIAVVCSARGNETLISDFFERRFERDRTRLFDDVALAQHGVVRRRKEPPLRSQIPRRALSGCFRSQAVRHHRNSACTCEPGVNKQLHRRDAFALSFQRDRRQLLLSSVTAGIGVGDNTMRHRAIPAATMIVAAGLIGITQARLPRPIRDYRDRVSVEMSQLDLVDIPASSLGIRVRH